MLFCYTVALLLQTIDARRGLVVRGGGLREEVAKAIDLRVVERDRYQVTEATLQVLAGFLLLFQPQVPVFKWKPIGRLLAAAWICRDLAFGRLFVRRAQTITTRRTVIRKRASKKIAFLRKIIERQRLPLELALFFLLAQRFQREASMMAVAGCATRSVLKLHDSAQARCIDAARTQRVRRAIMISATESTSLPRESKLAIEEARRLARLAIDDIVHSQSSALQKADRQRLAQQPALRAIRSVFALTPFLIATAYLHFVPNRNNDIELKAASAAIGALTFSQGMRRLYLYYGLDAGRTMIDFSYSVAARFHKPFSYLAGGIWRIRIWSTHQARILGRKLRRLTSLSRSFLRKILPIASTLRAVRRLAPDLAYRRLVQHAQLTVASYLKENHAAIWPWALFSAGFNVQNSKLALFMVPAYLAQLAALPPLVISRLASRVASAILRPVLQLLLILQTKLLACIDRRISLLEKVEHLRTAISGIRLQSMIPDFFKHQFQMMRATFGTIQAATANARSQLSNYRSVLGATISNEHDNDEIEN